MSKPKIDAKLVLDDLRAGFDDTYLMEKYNLSARGLQSLFEKLVAGGLVDRRLLEGGRPQPGAETSPGDREVSAKEVLTDLRSGMTQDAMMHKYRLSARGLANLFEQLVDAGLIAESELDQGSSLENTVEITEEGFGDVMTKAQEERPKAGGETPVDSQPEIGANVAANGPVPLDENAKRLWQCPSCKEPFSGEGDRCPKCGIAIARFLSDQDRPFGDEPSISMDQTMELVWQCPHCRTRQYKVFDVCPECGLAVDEQATYGAGVEGEKEPQPSLKDTEPDSRPTAAEALSDLRKDPDIEVSWLRDGLHAGAAEFQKRPYTKLIRLARALNWIAVLQLAVVVSMALARFLVLKREGESTAFAMPALIIPSLISLMGYGLLRSVSETIRMGIDMAHSLTENNRLLAQILDRTKRGDR